MSPGAIRAAQVSTTEQFTAEGTLASGLPYPGAEAGVTQRSVEAVIGRLVTDEEFRDMFRADPHRALADLLARGTRTPRSGSAVADDIDQRLQKASLKS